MDGATFNSVFTFLALNRRYNKTENYDIIFATLVKYYNLLYLVMLCPSCCIYFIVIECNRFEKAGTKMSKFLKGTLILMIAGLITRLLGFINRIVIARMTGEEGVGLFMMAFPTLVLVISLVQIGLPVAISKAVAEAEARGDKRPTKKILAVSLTVTISLSLLFTPTLMLLAPYLAETLFTDTR